MASGCVGRSNKPCNGAAVRGDAADGALRTASDEHKQRSLLRRFNIGVCGIGYQEILTPITPINKKLDFSDFRYIV